MNNSDNLKNLHRCDFFSTFRAIRNFTEVFELFVSWTESSFGLNKRNRFSVWCFTTFCLPDPSSEIEKRIFLPVPLHIRNRSSLRRFSRYQRHRLTRIPILDPTFLRHRFFSGFPCISSKSIYWCTPALWTCILISERWTSGSPTSKRCRLADAEICEFCELSDHFIRW